MIIRNDSITEASLGISVADPNAQAYINRLSSVENVSVERAGYINDFFVALKAKGIWSKIRLMWPMIGSVKEALLLEASGNYKVGSFWLDLHYAGNGTTTFSSNGINPNYEYWALYVSDSTGTNDPGLLPAAYKWSQIMGGDINDCHAALYSKTQRSIYEAYTVSGSAASTNQTEIYLNSNERANVLFRASFGLNDAAYTSATYSNTKGFFVSSRTSSTNMSAYNDGNLIGTNTTSNSGASFPDNRISVLSGEAITCCFASVGNGLTAQQQLDYYTIVNNLQTQLGRAN